MNWSRPRNGPRAESVATTAVVLVGRAPGCVTIADIVGPGPVTDFIYSRRRVCPFVARGRRADRSAKSEPGFGTAGRRRQGNARAGAAGVKVLYGCFPPYVRAAKSEGMQHDSDGDGIVWASVRLLLLGPARWGSVSVRRDRCGVASYRLIVYPPGSTDAERRRIRIWRGWPVWGTTLWVVAGILLESVVGTTLAFVGASVVALSAGLAAYRAAKPCAARVRTIGVVLPAGSPNMGRRAARDQLLRLSESLAFADELRAAGRLSPLEYEVVWSSAYHQMRPPSLSHEQFDKQRKETP